MTDRHASAHCLLCLALLAAGIMRAARANPDRPTGAAPAAPTAPASFPQAAEVLARVRANLPEETVRIKGELLCGERRGKLDRVFYLEAQLQLGQVPVTAAYTLRDGFGAAAAQLTMTRQPDGAWRRDYAAGRPLQSAPPPPADSLIGDSDVTWNDLSLAFLWWTEGAIAGREKFLERDCLVLEFTPPEAPRRTRVWIDENLLVLIKVEEYDAQQALKRRITVRTFKKIGGTWMIKDMDIRRWPGNHRTLLRLNDVAVVSGEEEPGDQPSQVNGR